MKPILPKGTRDFLPTEVRKRDFIFDTIKQVFAKYGFAPIETPAMEDLRTLTGKYGEEGDQLLFKVLNNGDYLKKADKDALSRLDSNLLIPSISKRGLRYDLTIPFARYVVMHQNDLSFPFKRYQIQPVWRADRPQKGRYQEFYQCDVDVVGSDSLMYEAELVQIYDEVFTDLNISVDIKLNNRKILFGMAEAAGIADAFMEMTIAIDKLDKIGVEGVKNEMIKAEIPESSIEMIIKMLSMDDLSALLEVFTESETGREGVKEIQAVLSYLEGQELKQNLVFDITLARGLNYYTGCIFEVAASSETYPDLKMGSIGGGGRYADLTGVFGMKDMSGVGISFGAERIYDVMSEEHLFPGDLDTELEILLLAFDEASHRYAFRCVSSLRGHGIIADIYPEPAKFKKQMKYANDRKVPYILIIGEEEMNSGQLSFKNMLSGKQYKLTLDEVVEALKNQI